MVDRVYLRQWTRAGPRHAGQDRPDEQAKVGCSQHGVSMLCITSHCSRNHKVLLLRAGWKTVSPDPERHPCNSMLPPMVNQNLLNQRMRVP